MLHQGVSALAYGVRINVIAKYLGQLCGVIAVLNLAPLAVALGYGEYTTGLVYLSVAAVFALVALIATRLRVVADMQINEALIITALAFILAALGMSYSFMHSAGLSWMDALFEAVSGITTTGLSTVVDVQAQSHSFVFARAWLQWYGGLGVVVMSLALVMGPGAVARRLAGAGGDVDDIPGSSRAYARRVMAVYLLLTVSASLAAMALGQDPFNAVVQALASVSTGGFSSFNDSLEGLANGGVRTVVLTACLCGAMPLALYYQAWRNGWRQLPYDREIQTLLLFGLVVALVLWLTWPDHGETNTFGQAVAMAVSAQTTSGFTVVDVATLPADSKGVLILSMALGGSMGSTAGGIKILRLLILLKLLQMILLRSALPSHAVIEARLQGIRLEHDETQRAMLIIVLYVWVILLSWLPFLAYGHDPLNALFEVVSATATVGLSAGLTASALEPLLKIVLCLDMLLGRLEIVALLILCYPTTWLGKKRTIHENRIHRGQYTD
ncbi:MAG: TrkH family potassium uptake protein [Candidatus Competibacteraceae bacterium]|nr:TrkH family potassium uptake protein [Candidatus Competibacteraceae bacterium]